MRLSRDTQEAEEADENAARKEIAEAREIQEPRKKAGVFETKYR